MTQKRSSRIIIALIFAVVLLVPAAVAYADSHVDAGPAAPVGGCTDCDGTGVADPPPIAITCPRLASPPI